MGLGFEHLGFGLGLRVEHVPHILSASPEVDFFEVISENVMASQGRPRAVVEAIAERYPIVLHGVAMNIGSTDPLDKVYLDELRQLAEALSPAWISDHLCWTGVGGLHSHDLLPLPYDEATLAHVVDRVRRVQDHLGRPLILENPSSYVRFQASTMSEWEFLGRLAEEADCGLLVDVNNVAVSCFNHGWDPETYLNALDADRIAQLHLAGHSDLGTHRIDTHDGPVSEEVWRLFSDFYRRIGGAATLIEWDAELPAFEVLAAEVSRAAAIAKGGAVEKMSVTPSSRATIPHPLHRRDREVAS